MSGVLINFWDDKPARSFLQPLANVVRLACGLVAATLVALVPSVVRADQPETDANLPEVTASIQETSQSSRLVPNGLLNAIGKAEDLRQKLLEIRQETLAKHPELIRAQRALVQLSVEASAEEYRDASNLFEIRMKKAMVDEDISAAGLIREFEDQRRQIRKLVDQVNTAL